MKTLFRAGGVVLIVVVLVFTGQSWSKPKPTPAPLARIALLNLNYVRHNMDRWKTFQQEFKEVHRQYEARAQDTNSQIDKLAKEAEDQDAPAEKREAAKEKIKELKRK